jgi:hypothetical protein
MRSEQAGVWFVPANGEEDTAVLVKASTTALKALLSGCPLGFIFGVKDGYLCSGVRIYDMLTSPLLLCSVQRHEEEHSALRKVLREKRSPLFLFNELDVCVAWSNGKLTEPDALLLLDFLGSQDQLYCGQFTAEASTALDSFCFTVDSTQKMAGAVSIQTIEIPVSHGPWVSNKVAFVGHHDSQKFVLEDCDEGAVLEKTVWASLESVFPLTLHKSPQVHAGEKMRELTDVVAFHQFGTFLIEAKDLSIFRAGLDRTRDRRIKGVQKQAKGAIAQLVGASKAVRRGERVTDLKGNTLLLVLDQPLHCIVLVTELMHEGDWGELERMLREAMIQTGEFFHLFDLLELIELLKASNGKPELFDYNLMQRCKKFAEVGSIHIRSCPAS